MVLIAEKINEPDPEKIDVASATEGNTDEKHEHDVSPIRLSEGDEALRLIGAERAVQFSEQYNLRLRRKLVCFGLSYNPQ